MISTDNQKFYSFPYESLKTQVMIGIFRSPNILEVLIDAESLEILIHAESIKNIPDILVYCCSLPQLFLKYYIIDKFDYCLI